jgi:hypothetical protein
MTDAERAARYSDLFGRDPRFAPEGEDEPPAPPADFRAHQHAHPSECAHCPICATLAVLRNVKPEVVEHLAAAARELVIAAGLLVEEAGKVVGVADTAASPPEQPPANVRRLDLG